MLLVYQKKKEEKMWLQAFVPTAQMAFTSNSFHIIEEENLSQYRSFWVFGCCPFWLWNFNHYPLQLLLQQTSDKKNEALIWSKKSLSAGRLWFEPLVSHESDSRRERVPVHHQTQAQFRSLNYSTNFKTKQYHVSVL